MSIKKIFLVGLIPFLLNVSPLKSEENKKPSIEINFKSDLKNYLKPSKFENVKPFFYRSDETFEIYKGKSPLNNLEEKQIENLFLDIKNGEINSYNSLLNSLENFSDDQKLIFLQSMRFLLEIYSTENSLFNSKRISQEDFFKKITDSIRTGNQNEIGVCKQKSSLMAKFLNDLKIPSAVVTGMSKSLDKSIGHAFVLSKTKKGVSILDNGLYSFNTKNIEKILLAYQNQEGRTTFQHFFLKDDKIKYELITEDGKNFFDFIDYKPSTRELKKFLNNSPKKQPDIKMDLENSLKKTSVSFNSFGFFSKLGLVEGSSSPLNEMFVVQNGFDKTFHIPEVFKLNLDASFIYSKLFYDVPENIFSIKGNLSVGTNKSKGLNFANRFTGNVSFVDTQWGLSPMHIGAQIQSGLSYKMHLNNLNLEPYILTEFSFLPLDLGTNHFAFQFSDLVFGINSKIKFNKYNSLNLDLYYSKKIWEQEFGTSLNFESEKFKIDFGAYITQSNYEFCPNKYGLNLGLYTKSKNSSLGIKYFLEGVNYDNEFKNKHSLELEANFKVR